MNQQLITITNSDQAWTDSLTVAAKFKKQHHNVLRAIQNLECSDKFSRLNFELADYVDEQGKPRPMFRISRDGFSMLAMGFTGKEAAAWKEKFIGAFNKMEKLIFKEAEERKLARDAAKDSIRLIGFVLETSRAEAGKVTKSHHFSNEARLINIVMGELFGHGDRSSMDKTQLRALDKLQHMNCHLISKGLSYQDRKDELRAYGARILGTPAVSGHLSFAH